MLNIYSGLEIVQQLYNNYYKQIIWPTLLSLGQFILCIPFAVLIAKWKLVSGDPRLLILCTGIVNGSLIVIVLTTCGSKLNEISVDFLTKTCTVNLHMLQNLYYRRKLKSKRPLAVKVANNFIDQAMPLTVLESSIDNMISLLMVLNK